VIFRNSARFILRGTQQDAPSPTPTPKLEDHFLLAAYSIYRQLASIAGGSLLHPKGEDAPRGDKTPT